MGQIGGGTGFEAVEALTYVTPDCVILHTACYMCKKDVL